MKRSGFKPRPAADPGCRIEAYNRSFGLCIVCGDPAHDPHHILSQERFIHLRNTAENIAWLCRGCHANHTSAFKRIPRDRLPGCVFGLADREGPTAQAFLDRYYA